MFAVAAIGSMMALAGEGREAREGTRMGLWGAAQAMAAGFGGLVGRRCRRCAARLLTTDARAFGTVFLFEAAPVHRRRCDGGADHGHNARRKPRLVPGE